MIIIRRVWEIPGGLYDRSEKRIAVLPIGSVERHGDHLPLGTDTIEAQYVAEKIAERLNADLFPPIWYGSTRSMRGFPGSIDIDPDVLYAYVRNILREISRNGYRLIVVVNGHGGNSHIIRLAARETAYQYGAHIIVFDWWSELAQEERKRLFASPGHAGEDETSVMLYIAPHTVDMSLAKTHLEKPLNISLFSRSYDEKLYPEALLGDAVKGDAERGRAWLEKVVEDAVNKILEAMRILGI